MNQITALDRTTIRRNITITGKPPAAVIDGLIRTGFQYDERSQQWWKYLTAGDAIPVQQLQSKLDQEHIDLMLNYGISAPTGDDHQYRYQSYYTPEPLAKELVALAAIQKGMTCLEPSAGTGVIARAMVDAGGLITCVEADPDAYLALEDDFNTVVSGDFLSMDNTPGGLGLFDRICMNPPFSRDQDARHVCHAFSFLKPGGKLVAIVGSYALNGKTDDRRRLQDLIRQYGRLIREIAPGTFDNNARAVIIELNKSM
jgi:predicted RNA methylase